jgi:hypothetical protein
VWLPETDVPLDDPWKVSWLVARRRRRRAEAALRRYQARVRATRGSLIAILLSTLVAALVSNMGDERSAASGEPRDRAAAATPALSPEPQWDVPGMPNPHPATLARIAECESRGDPTAIGGGGLHRGKYQFTFATWYDMGGRGDPALAPEGEQDRRAALLLLERGTAPWPNCA